MATPTCSAPGLANTLPATLAVRSPAPTNPAKLGSCPDPPPLTIATRCRCCRPDCALGPRYTTLWSASRCTEGLSRGCARSEAATAVGAVGRKCLSVLLMMGLVGPVKRFVHHTIAHCFCSIPCNICGLTWSRSTQMNCVWHKVGIVAVPRGGGTVRLHHSTHNSASLCGIPCSSGDLLDCVEMIDRILFRGIFLPKHLQFDPQYPYLGNTVHRVVCVCARAAITGRCCTVPNICL